MTSPLEALSAIFRCPNCGNETLGLNRISSPVGSEQLSCSGCGSVAPYEDGILDFASASGPEFITPFQRLMQFSPLAAIYSNYWRPLGFFVASSVPFRRFSECVLALVDPSRHGLILDLACGPGLFSYPLCQKTKGWVIGLDLSQPMLGQARRLLRSGGVCNALLVRGSAFHLPFRDGCLDAILCAGALHLFDRPDSALKEMSRTLSPGGRLVCQTTIRPRHSAGIASFLDKIIRFGFFASAQEVHDSLSRAGFRVEYTWAERIIYLFQAQKL